MSKELSAALAKRELMVRTGASAASIEVMDRRIAKLQPKPKGEGKENGAAQIAEQPEVEVNGFDAAVASFASAAHRNLCTKCQHTSRVLDAAGIEYEIAS